MGNFQKRQTEVDLEKETNLDLNEKSKGTAEGIAKREEERIESVH